MSYSKKVIDHFENPRNVGTLDKNDPNVGTGLVGAPACLTGDTLVAVADGRKFVSIKELAEAGKDVPIYAYSDDEGIIVCNGYLPRLTKKNAECVEVFLDDGSSFKCTPDHLVRTRNRKSDFWIEASNLKYNQSLMPFTRVLRRDYYSIHSNMLLRGRPREHRLIYEYFHGEISPGYQVHHKNHKKLDNNIENLELLNGADHMRHHNIYRMHVEGKKPSGRDIIGDKNPMREWWGNRATEEDKLNYRVNMSISTSGERNGRWIPVLNEELVKSARVLLDGYGKLTANMWAAFAKAKKWPQSLSARFGRFSDFKQEVLDYNHKVVEIKPAGKHNVYCLTVDNVSNFSIITNVSKKRHTGIVVHNCGDVMRLQIKVDDNGMIEEAKFKTFGCGSAVASSSLATEWIKGKSIGEAETIRNTEIVEELNLPPVKVHCSVLAEDAIKSAIQDYRAKQAARKALEKEDD